MNRYIRGLSISVCSYLSIYLCLCEYVYVNRAFCMYACITCSYLSLLSIDLSIPVRMCGCECRFTGFCLFISIYLSIYFMLFISIYLSIYLFPIHISDCLYQWYLTASLQKVSINKHHIIIENEEFIVHHMQLISYPLYFYFHFQFFNS